MTGKPSCPVRREAARKRTCHEQKPRRAADPTSWMNDYGEVRRSFQRTRAKTEFFRYLAATLATVRLGGRPDPRARKSRAGCRRAGRGRLLRGAPGAVGRGSRSARQPRHGASPGIVVERPAPRQRPATLRRSGAAWPQDRTAIASRRNHPGRPPRSCASPDQPALSETAARPDDFVLGLCGDDDDAGNSGDQAMTPLPKAKARQPASARLARSSSWLASSRPPHAAGSPPCGRGSCASHAADARRDRLGCAA
jgi:hypothetical protein